MLPLAEVRQQCGLPARPIYLFHSPSLFSFVCKLQRLESALSLYLSLTKRVTCVQTSAARRVILIYGIAVPGGATAWLKLLPANACPVT